MAKIIQMDDGAPPAHTEISESGPWQQALTGGANGTPLSNLENLVFMLANSPDLREQFWYEEFKGVIMTSWCKPPARAFEDHDASLLKHYAQTRGGMKKATTADCHEAVAIVARHHARNECKDWLSACVWDKTPRLETMMADLFGAEQSDYAAAVGRCWMVSMVARVFVPGCKVDTVPVFESEQGNGKSTALEDLGGKWYAVANGDITNKDFLMLMDGNMILELAEMQGFSKADVERIKGIISTRVDRYRRPYGRLMQDNKRQTVLACTTNRHDWNRDHTGARRFWPIRCGEINLDYAKNNRDQLFAEAREFYEKTPIWWDVPTLDQQRETDARRESDAWDEPIRQYLIGKSGPIHCSEVLIDGLKVLPSALKKGDEMRVADVLKSLGWSGQRIRMGGEKRHLWLKNTDIAEK